MNSTDGARTLSRAERLVRLANANLKAGHPTQACSMAVRAARAALRAFLIFQEGQSVKKRSVEGLLRLCLMHDQAFSEAIEAGRILDKYYDMVRSSSPMGQKVGDAQTSRMGADAVALAMTIIRLVRSRIKGADGYSAVG